MRIGNRTYTIVKRTNRDSYRQESPRTYSSMMTNHIAAYLVVRDNETGREYLAKLFESGKAVLM